MYKLPMKKLKAKLLLAALILLPLEYAHCAITDIDQQVIIKSNRQASDIKNKIASYLDNVEITQGSLSIKADIVQVVSQENTENKIYVASGKPAIFKQLLDDGQPIILQANQIKYEPAKHTITISGNASVSQEGSLVSGNIIIYNILTEQLNAEKKTDSNERVTTILQPKLKDKKNP